MSKESYIHNMSLTLRPEADEYDVEDEIDRYDGLYYSVFDNFYKKEDDTGTISYEIRNFGEKYDEEEWSKFTELFAKFFDGRVNFRGYDGSHWSVLMKDGVVKKELSPTKDILVDKGGAHWTAMHLNDNNANSSPGLYRTREALKKEQTDTLTKEQANKILELKEEANKIDTGGWGCESENIRMGYCPDPFNTSKFIPCNIFRNNAFGVYILADYNGDILLHNANNLITKELREFMKIEGEMKKVMDDPEYGKEFSSGERIFASYQDMDQRNMESDKGLSDEDSRQKIYSFQGEELNEEKEAWMNEFLDDLELSE